MEHGIQLNMNISLNTLPSEYDDDDDTTTTTTTTTTPTTTFN
jgi:hypothetical protein